MIEFKKHTLANGLQLIVHEDESTQTAAVNIVYNVGARDEDPERTGFAHLFEHLMFGGSKHIDEYDVVAQQIGAENNAFTNNDITNYYLSFPAPNLETALWLESDRMAGLAFSQKALDVQRNVVIEEFKQRYLNQPYGDVWLKLRPLAWKVHPYRWPTIGREIKHIEDARLEDVEDFFYKFYRPNNAIMAVAGNVKFDETVELVEKWFGDIEAAPRPSQIYLPEPRQTEARFEEVEADVPANMLFKAFHAPARASKGFYHADVLSDVLSRGTSSRLFRRLVKDNPLFSDLSAGMTGEDDGGLLIVNGRLREGVAMDVAEKALNEELNLLRTEQATEEEMVKIKNQIEATTIFGEMGALNVAMNLCFSTLQGDTNLVNTELDMYRSTSAANVQTIAEEILRPENCSTLYYFSKNQR